MTAFISGIRAGKEGQDKDWTTGKRTLRSAPEYDLSILIPVYNAEKYIAEAVGSCSSERYSVEIIAVDDGSSDRSFAALCSCLQDCAVPAAVVKRSHRGQAASRNDALSLARGRHILYLDADDYFLSGAVDLMMDAVANPNATEAVLVSALCRDFISPELTAEEASALEINPQPYRRMLAGCMLSKRELFDRIGTFNEDMPTSETADWVLRLRDAKLPVKEIEDTVLMRRYHKTNLGRERRKEQLGSYMALVRRRLKERQDADRKASPGEKH